MTLQRISIDIDKDLWKQIGFKALEESKKKREIVEIALQEYLKKQN